VYAAATARQLPFCEGQRAVKSGKKTSIGTMKQTGKVGRGSAKALYYGWF